MNTLATPLPLPSMFPIETYTIVLKETEKGAIKPMNETHMEEKELV